MRYLLKDGTTIPKIVKKDKWNELNPPEKQIMKEVEE